MSERIIEGRWRCSSCALDDILGRERKCPRCGNPREANDGESKFDFGARTAAGGLTAPSVDDEAGLQAARAGPDWACAYCGCSNRGMSAQCASCGASLSEGTAGVERALDEPSSPPPPPPLPTKPSASSSRRWRWMGLGVGAAIVVVGAGLVAGLRTHPVRAERAGVRWERRIFVEEFKRVTRSGWRDELRPRSAVMPAGGVGEVPGVENIRRCRREVRGSRKVPAGTQRVCRMRTRREQCGTEQQCEVQDLGNGFAKEVCRDRPKYCQVEREECADEVVMRDEPVFGERCEYDSFAWERIAELERKGGADEPRWPDVPRGDRPIRERRSERYVVVWRYDVDGSSQVYEQVLTRAEDYLRWKGLRNVTLELSSLRGVTAVHPVE